MNGVRITDSRRAAQYIGAKRTVYHEQVVEGVAENSRVGWAVVKHVHVLSFNIDVEGANLAARVSAIGQSS